MSDLFVRTRGKAKTGADAALILYLAAYLGFWGWRGYAGKTVATAALSRKQNPPIVPICDNQRSKMPNRVDLKYGKFKSSIGGSDFGSMPRFVVGNGGTG